MAILQDILPLSFIKQVHGVADLEINGMAIDSRQVLPGFLFAAIKGTQVDGHKFIETAISKGAIAILCEHLPETLKEGVCYITTLNAPLALGHLASNYYDNPSQQMNVVAITGTNGKTSTATLLKNATSHLGFKTGLISTVQIEIGEEIIPATHTTPHAIAIQEVMAQMVEAGCEYVFMEASSHAIEQNRIAGIDFDGAVFTNLTHDHLDYHKTFDNYIKAKKLLFDQLPAKAFALTNTDDKNGKVMLQNTKAQKRSYSLKALSTYKTKVLEQDFTSMLLEINGKEVYVPISGTFNAYNLTAAYGSLVELDFDEEETLMALSQAKGAEGRLEWLLGDQKKVGIVDYAHTPDALENVLKAIKSMNTNNGNIITVVGCGGDRDKTKRPIMAKIAAEMSNRLILTSDNPRSEDPDSILQEMEEGVPLHRRLNALTITDRRNAIKTACSLAQYGDLILVAGKGHEKYQEVNGVKQPFDDKEVLKEFLLTEKR